MTDSKISAKRDAPPAVTPATEPVPPALAQARAEAHRRVAEIGVELQKLTSGSWQTSASRGAQALKLRSERALLEGKLWLDPKGAALEKAAVGLIAESQKAMTHDAKSRTWLGPVGGAIDFVQQGGADALEGMLGIAAGVGQLAQVGGISRVEDALLHHPLQTATTLGKAIVKHTADIYEANGLGAALGDVATLGLAGLGEARLVSKAMTFGTKVSAPWPAAIANGVQTATGIAAEKALPVANAGVKVAVGVYVAKKAVELGGATAASELVGNEVRAASSAVNAKDPGKRQR